MDQSIGVTIHNDAADPTQSSKETSMQMSGAQLQTILSKTAKDITQDMWINMQKTTLG